MYLVINSLNNFIKLYEKLAMLFNEVIHSLDAQMRWFSSGKMKYSRLVSPLTLTAILTSSTW